MEKKLSLESITWWTLIILYGGILLFGLGAMFFAIFQSPTPGASLGFMVGTWVAIVLVAVLINKMHD